MRLAGLPRRRPWAFRPGSPAGTGKKIDLTDRMTWCGRPAAARLRTLRRLGPLRRWPLQCCMAFPFGLVALAAGKHPFPSRTRPLRLHAVMILRPGARESNASPIPVLQVPCPLEGRGLFLSPGVRRRVSGAADFRRARRGGLLCPFVFFVDQNWTFSARERGMCRRRPRQPAHHWAGSSPRGSAGCTDGVLAVG